MTPRSAFQTKPLTALLAAAAIGAVLPAAALAKPAAHVDFAIGTVIAKGSDGKIRPLGKGSDVLSGDTVTTQPGARAQLRFTDGQYVSVQPDSSFRVDQYNYDGKPDGSEKGFFSLLKGGFRAITGLIGKIHRNSYQVATSVATIGIRGTAYSVETTHSGTFIVWEGRVELINEFGHFLIDRNTGKVTILSLNSDALTDDQIAALIEQAKEGFEQFLDLRKDDLIADDRNEDGQPIILNGKPPDCSQGDCVLLANFAADGLEGDNYFSNVKTTYSDKNELVSYSTAPSGVMSVALASLNSYVTPPNGQIGTAQASDVGGDGIIGWTRWTSGTVTGSNNYPFSYPVTLKGQESIDLIYGKPTPYEEMPNEGMGTYSLLGAFTPNWTDGQGPEGLGKYTGTTGYMTLNFNNYSSPVGLYLDINFQNTTYKISAGSVSGLYLYGSQFYGSGNLTTTTNGFDCVEGCSTYIDGQFFGPRGIRAGEVHSIRSDHMPKVGNVLKMTGGATFAQDPGSTLQTVPLD